MSIWYKLQILNFELSVHHTFISNKSKFISHNFIEDSLTQPDVDDYLWSYLQMEQIYLIILLTLKLSLHLQQRGIKITDLFHFMFLSNIWCLTYAWLYACWLVHLTRLLSKCISTSVCLCIKLTEMARIDLIPSQLAGIVYVGSVGL